MKITYLKHSGFLVETEIAYYLFDYIGGKLPGFTSGKPLYVFASHAHDDHFSKRIFSEEISRHVTKYILSYDIKSEKVAKNQAEILWTDENKTYIIEDSGFTIEVKTLHSTDLGVAFIVREKTCDNMGKSIYHAGDLNWWHWEGEPDPWNPDMARDYKREIDKIAGEAFDVAFVPLDPRLENEYWYGLGYFEEKVDAAHIFPMHLWGEYDLIKKYVCEHRQTAEENETTIHLITMEDENYEI